MIKKVEGKNSRAGYLKNLRLGKMLSQCRVLRFGIEDSVGCCVSELKTPALLNDYAIFCDILISHPGNTSTAG